MTQDFKFAHRKARVLLLLLSALLFTLASCSSTDVLTPETPTTPPTDGGSDKPSQAIAYAGGIPFGAFKLPTTLYGSTYNGAYRNIYPEYLKSELAAIKNRGGKVVLMFAGPERYYKDSDGHFSMSKWKARIDRFRNVNFSSFITDGTIIAHYLIDEPNDPRNWNNRPVPPSTIEEMAKYSKQIWPGMATIVRTWPDYLDNWSGSFHYLDAAWAQYEIHRFPNVNDFISTNVNKAKAKGLALVFGLNVIDGGSQRQTNMTPSQIKTYGSALLSSSYPCAFISWQYRDRYFTSSVTDAMKYLRNKAQSRPYKTCRGS